MNKENALIPIPLLYTMACKDAVDYFQKVLNDCNNTDNHLFLKLDKPEGMETISLKLEEEDGLPTIDIPFYDDPQMDPPGCVTLILEPADKERGTGRTIRIQLWGQKLDTPLIDIPIEKWNIYIAW